MVGVTVPSPVLQCHLVPCARGAWHCAGTSGPLSLLGAAGCQPSWCPPRHRYVWEKDGAPLSPESGPRVRLDEAGALHISQTWSGDIGTYTCKVVSAGGNDSRSAHLRVR